MLRLATRSYYFKLASAANPTTSICKRPVIIQVNEFRQTATATQVGSPNPLIRVFDEFTLAYPDFLPSVVWNRRDPLFQELSHADMLERRTIIDIPEFYVGSVLAVTMADPNMSNRLNRFVGICIRRHKEGLQHHFTLRNVIDGLGVEVMFEMYNPTIQKIEVLLLEKRLDEDLTYLVDALPEYSTFDFNMEQVPYSQGKPVPVNPLKVKLRPPPWTLQWFRYRFNGIEDCWPKATPWFKRKFIRVGDILDFKKFDIIEHYRDSPQELEYDLLVQQRIIEFEENEFKHKRAARKKTSRWTTNN